MTEITLCPGPMSDKTVRPEWCNCLEAIRGNGFHVSYCPAMTGIPDTLEIPAPDCPMCTEYLEADGLVYYCKACRVSWPIDGGEGEPDA